MIHIGLLITRLAVLVAHLFPSSVEHLHIHRPRFLCPPNRRHTTLRPSDDTFTAKKRRHPSRQHCSHRRQPPASNSDHSSPAKMAKEWINSDESAKQMLGRVLRERPVFLLPRPLDRVPLGISNILEIIGPSSSAKTEILLQVAVNCILPKHRKGVQYGGLEQSVLFLDLDCRLDIFHLSQSLKLRITEVNRLHNTTNYQEGFHVSVHDSNHQGEDDGKELYNECMKRFSYTRCYDSFEFLAALKVLNYKLEKERKTNGDGRGVHVLMIDSIGAFYWVDRGFSSLPQGNPNRKNICLQSVFESVVGEIKKLSLLHPMIVIATKTVTKQAKSSYSSRASGFLNNTYREYMPSIWQSFVTHRILVRHSDEKRKLEDRVCYLAEWLLPALSITDEFVVGDGGILYSL